MHYIINENTLFFLKTKKLEIKEKNKLITIDENVNKILDESCNYYGSSYQGRKKATKYLIGISSKSTIILNERKNMLLFPIFSPRNSQSLWFVYNNILNYHKVNKYVEVTFKNNEKITFLISYNIFHNQILKCSYLLAISSLNFETEKI